jgi:hypothetical protein
MSVKHEKYNVKVSDFSRPYLLTRRKIKMAISYYRIENNGLPKSQVAPQQIRRRGQGCGPRPPPRIHSASARLVGRRGLEVGTQSPARCKHNHTQKTVSEGNLQNARFIRTRGKRVSQIVYQQPLFVLEDPHGARTFSESH